jgi:hypothetical protein
VVAYSGDSRLNTRLPSTSEAIASVQAFLSSDIVRTVSRRQGKPWDTLLERFRETNVQLDSNRSDPGAIRDQQRALLRVRELILY